ncbi:uncharacterized protein LOC131347125 isoform X3 [Hemibagrus wyckioides]|uniref:uncharacterized protein LOC131347125 isoform X3 n=1 Tax=Hemibagrus wyckioides TaxID=337641 RepID=UPI00266D7F8D|nr:uncharacterized protein LOC131347125 isoform X3 [Hemibagrus wyckioides]
MAGSGSNSGNRDCPDSVSPHASMTRNSDDFFATVNKLTSEARNKACNRYKQFDPPFVAFPNTQNPCGAGDFVTDEMSGYGGIDFVAVDEFRNGYGFNDSRRSRTHRGRWAGRNGGYYERPERGGYPPRHYRRGRRGNLRRHGKGPDILSGGSESGPGPVPGSMGAVQRTFSPTGMDLGAELDYISRRREKDKLRKRRRRALKAAAKAQAAKTAQEAPDLRIIATVDEAAGAGTETLQVQPEHDVRKRKERPTADDEPERKTVRTEPSGENSTNKMEAAERTHRTASNPAAPGHSTVLSIEEELARLKMKLQQKKVPLSDSAGHTEETKEDVTPAPASTSAAEGQSFKKKHLEAKTEHATHSTKPYSRRLRKLHNEQRKQGYFGMKITAQRLAFICSVCKFRSFYRKNMTAHLQSQFHKDHFKFLSEHLPKATVDFLQSHFSNKHKKVENLINQIPDHRATICQLYEDQDLTQDISMDHFMRKAEAAHCLACDVYMPMQKTLIQEHLNSPDHKCNCQAMMVHSKQSGLSIAQSILSERYIRKKLKLYLKDSVVTDGPEVEPEEAWSAGQRTAPETDMMTQEAELCECVNRAVKRRRDEENQEGELCGQVNQAGERIRDGKDQEAELCGQVNQAGERIRDGKDQEVELCGQVNQALERISDGKDQEARSLCGQVNQAVERRRDGKDQEAESLCGQVNQAVERRRDGKYQEAESLCGQVNQAVERRRDGKDQEAESLCGQVNQAVERRRDGKDQEAESLCGQVNQAVERRRDGKDQEAESLCGQVNQAVERRRDGKDQEAESLCGQAVQAAGAVINKKGQQSEAVCEETVPAVETIKNVPEEPEQHHPTNSLFDLLDDEDDVEGVELGEEEMGEADI